MTREAFDQDTPWPTRKLGTGALVGPAAAEAWGAVMRDLYPPLAGPAMSILVGTMAAVAVAYWVRDTKVVG